MSIDVTIWKHTESTQKLLREIDYSISKAKNEILEFGGVMTSPYLEREYCRALGFIDGLKAVKEIIEDMKDEDA